MKKLYFLLFILIGLTSVNHTIAQGAETFNNLTLSGNSYTDGAFTGDNGVTWNYTQCRDENGDDNSSGIDGKAIMLRRISDNSAISAQSGANGVGGLTFKLYKGFTGGGDRQVELFVNGTSYGTSTPFDDYTEHIFTVTNINVTGDVLIEIRNNTGKQVIVDDVTWSTSGQTLSNNNFEFVTFSLFPNPTTQDFVTIKTTTKQPTTVIAFDILGKQVLKTVLKTNRLDVSELNAGVYILQLTQNETTTTKKLVVQ
ncbi:T9SS type A sorting domain-containing protein [Psychroserpens sp. NJDZ02]|uniref:T9SS type A sorting domain-containing protein n=1 Tax=Psychroserpens sp. NJDZ02 TaxID=2570561 RepID=UPI0010A876EB|nr:T9SS type A sorting domain-containing protein [Psychroserpens sp. NJDZ02]QCE41477.1 T9SS type A sorting domain-containing protein [Psychroserpens sp. NJDZ02]